MALLTRAAELPPVDIPVTTGTVARKPQKGLRSEERGIAPDVGCRPEFLPVALLADKRFVLSPERKSYGTMIECGPVEAHQREGTPVVLLMALRTSPAGQRTM
jgi:hypothetical protein